MDFFLLEHKCSHLQGVKELFHIKDEEEKLLKYLTWEQVENSRYTGMQVKEQPSAMLLLCKQADLYHRITEELRLVVTSGDQIHSPAQSRTRSKVRPRWGTRAPENGAEEVERKEDKVKGVCEEWVLYHGLISWSK